MTRKTADKVLIQLQEGLDYGLVTLDILPHLAINMVPRRSLAHPRSAFATGPLSFLQTSVPDAGSTLERGLALPTSLACAVEWFLGWKQC